MKELANKKLEPMAQAVIELIQLLCDYLGSNLAGRLRTNKQPPSNNFPWSRPRLTGHNSLVGAMYVSVWEVVIEEVSGDTLRGVLQAVGFSVEWQMWGSSVTEMSPLKRRKVAFESCYCNSEQEMSDISWT